MKKLILFFLFIYCSLFLFSQIPNGSFEEWEQIGNNVNPVNWQTNQDELTTRIIQDSIFKIVGEYSMHFVSQPPNTSQDCNNTLSSSFIVNGGLGENKSLFFALKLLSINSDNDVFFKVDISFFKNGQSLGAIDTSFQEEYDEFEIIEIPLNFPEANLIFLTFTGGAENGFVNNCFRRSVSWLDGLIILNSSITSINEIENPSIKIFPNPSFGKIEIQGDWEKYQSYKIYDLLGKELEEGKLQSAELRLKYKGVLFVILESDSGNQSIFKIINQ
ncbi:MAG: T9SS type A sorting domain-containing protein [Saprospiraceae bacterium]